MRNASFFHTQKQIRNRTKTETTRKGWEWAKVGMVLNACEKCQGLKKGEKVVKICKIMITKVEDILVRISDYTQEDVIAEGFPELTPETFVRTILLEKCKLKLFDPVKRITFEYI